ncbi:MAG TPA: hypothetical protein EYO42_05340 [Candidatus Poseidoniales archaeon]|nr:hypothetical protein [Candidatus Poseidoniales archaeon]HIB59940.1 hypothetical protein [Candidatus Poseidoniales archaeon]
MLIGWAFASAMKVTWNSVSPFGGMVSELGYEFPTSTSTEMSTSSVRDEGFSAIQSRVAVLPPLGETSMLMSVWSQLNITSGRT